MCVSEMTVFYVECDVKPPLNYNKKLLKKCWAHSPLRAAARRIAIHQVSLLSHAACASMSTTTTTTTTTTRDRGDRYGSIEWAQSARIRVLCLLLCGTVVVQTAAVATFGGFSESAYGAAVTPRDVYTYLGWCFWTAVAAIVLTALAATCFVVVDCLLCRRHQRTAGTKSTQQ